MDFDVNDAKRITNKAKFEKEKELNKEYEKVIVLIKENASKALNEVKLSFNITDYTIKKLKENGFIVSSLPSDHRFNSGDTYVIRW